MYKDKTLYLTVGIFASLAAFASALFTDFHFIGLAYFAAVVLLFLSMFWKPYKISFIILLASIVISLLFVLGIFQTLAGIS